MRRSPRHAGGHAGFGRYLPLVQVAGDLGTEVDDLELRLDPCHRRLLFFVHCNVGLQHR
jgi:hypothetical protein